MDPLLASHHQTLLRGTAAEWTARVGALRTLRTLARKQNSILRAALAAFVVPLATALGDLRSAVVKETCLCIEDLAVAYETDFGRVADALFPALLKASSVTTCIIATSASEASRVLITHAAKGLPSRTVEYIANAVVFEKSSPKSPIYRTTAAKSLGLLLAKGVHETFPERVLQGIRNSVLKGCSDRSVEVRNASRENWSTLETMEPVRAAKTLPDHPPNTLLTRIIHEDPTPQVVTVSARADKSQETRRRPQRAPLQPQSANIVIKPKMNDNNKTRNVCKPPRRSLAVGKLAAQPSVGESKLYPDKTKLPLHRPARRTMAISAMRPIASSPKSRVKFSDYKRSRSIKSNQAVKNDDNFCLESPDATVRSFNTSFADQSECPPFTTTPDRPEPVEPSDQTDLALTQLTQEVEFLQKQLIRAKLRVAILASRLWSRNSKCQITALESRVDVQPHDFSP